MPMPVSFPSYSSDHDHFNVPSSHEPLIRKEDVAIARSILKTAVLVGAIVMGGHKGCEYIDSQTQSAKETDEYRCQPSFQFGTDAFTWKRTHENLIAVELINYRRSIVLDNEEKKLYLASGIVTLIPKKDGLYYRFQKSAAPINAINRPPR